MPARTIDDDPYASLPDPTKPARTKGGAARSASAQDDDDPYRSLPDPWKPPEGVKVAGVNAAGQPIYAPAGQPQPTGSAARRFLQSAVNVLGETAKGLYHGVVEGPQNPEEAAIVAKDPMYGKLNLAVNRFIVAPMKSEAQTTAEEFRQSDPWSIHPSQEAIWHREKALGHGLATVLPGVGPWAAGVGEKAGTQAGTGDYAGAAGTLAGNTALYVIPEGLGRVAKSELVSRTIPAGQVSRMIRPSAADLRFGKDPAAAILSEGIVGNDLEQIGDRTYTRLREVGKQIDAEARKPVNAGKTVNLSGALKPLDDAMAEATRAGDKNLFNKLLDVKNELSNNWRPFRNVKGDTYLRPVGPRNMRMSPMDALTFKRMVGDRIRWTGEPLNGEVNQALGSVYGATKDAVNAQVPALRSLNERYSNLVGAAKAIERRLPVEARSAHWSLTDVVIGTHSIPLAAARHVARMPAVRSRAAAGLYNLPRVVPKRPGAMAAPVLGAAQSAQTSRERLRELQDEAQRRNPATAGAF
jgi:hypothetical protein